MKGDSLAFLANLFAWAASSSLSKRDFELILKAGGLGIDSPFCNVRETY